MSRFDRPDQICAASARSQFGAFNRTQALRAGHTEDSFQHRLDSGAWVRLLPNVYVFAGTPITWETRYMAATLWDPGRSAISGTAAAFRYGLSGFRAEPLELSTVSSRRAHSLGFNLRRMDHRLLEEITDVRGIPTVSPRRLVLELAGKKHARTGAALDQLWRRDLVELRDLWGLLEKEWTRGRRGIRIYRDLVVARTPGTAPTHSDLEDMFRAFVREYGFPKPVQQWPYVLPTIGLVHFDFGYPKNSLAIEVDSYAWHLDLKAFTRDRQRDIEAQLVGIRVLRVTYSMLRWERPYLAKMLELHLKNPPSGPSTAP